VKRGPEQVWLPIKKGTTHMIPWIKYDPANPPIPPENGERYMLIDDCKIPWTGYFENEIWVNDWDGACITEVTHYAHINLPEEEFTINHEPIKTIEVTAHIKNMGYQENTLKFEVGEEDRP
jgi:hypothetical protein